MPPQPICWRLSAPAPLAGAGGKASSTVAPVVIKRAAGSSGWFDRRLARRNRTVESPNMNLADERWRHAVLTNGPQGRWRTVPGTHAQLSDEAIRFDTDGTGEMQLSSLMSGHTSLKFLWRAAGHGVVECQPLYETSQLDGQGEQEPAEWLRLHFEIRQQATDAGTHWVLQELGTQGFWELTTPLVPET